MRAPLPVIDVPARPCAGTDGADAAAFADARGYVLYRGPSAIDGAPIVAIATMTSGNRKTGAMVQTWILRADVAPVDAVRTGADVSICGGCPHRRAVDGARSCYVNVGQAPRSIFSAWRAGRYPDVSADPAAMWAIGFGRAVRMGSYGDPAAVPAQVWGDLRAGADMHTAYSHQWRSKRLAAALRGAVMASCDSEADRARARSAGWGTFTVIAPDAPSPDWGEECASDRTGASCIDCGACDGAPHRDIWIRAHGSGAVHVGRRLRVLT